MSVARPFIRLDACFFDDSKVLSISEGAQLLYIACLCKAAVLRSDGHLVAGHLSRMGMSDWEARVTELLAVGLLESRGDGQYVIPKFTDWQKSQADYAKERERHAARRVHAVHTPGARDKKRKEEEKKEGVPTPTPPVRVAPEPPPAADPEVVGAAIAEIRAHLDRRPA